MRRSSAGRPGAAAAVAAALLFATVAVAGEAPGDIRFEHPAGSPLAPSLFSHWLHRLRFTCNACHPALFPMARTLKITLDDIREGRFCGACHNGRVAFGVTATTCNRCHVAPEP